MRGFMTFRAEWEDEAQWAAHIRPCPDAEFFARETAFVIINSGMRAQVAWGIWERVRDRLERNLPVAGSDAFRHPGKTAAIDAVWRDREDLFARFQTLPDDEARLAFLEGLPWIGGITKYHLAKNFGLAVAKPDRWLARVAEAHDTTVQAFCADMAAATGLPVPLVDTVVWRCCNLGAVAIEPGGIRPVDPWMIGLFEDADLNASHGTSAFEYGREFH
jgi:hypothetical protein